MRNKKNALLSDEEDRILGLHSNIPECCVTWWCKQSWEQLIKTHRLQDKIDGLEYRACPSCRKKLLRKEIKPNKLHHCTIVCLKVLKDYPGIVEYLQLGRKSNCG